MEAKIVTRRRIINKNESILVLGIIFNGRYFTAKGLGKEYNTDDFKKTFGENVYKQAISKEERHENTFELYLSDEEVGLLLSALIQNDKDSNTN